MMDLGAYMAFLCMVAVFSSALYKVNTLSKWAEYTLVATNLANIVVIGAKTIQSKGIDPMLTGNYMLIIPLLIGVLCFTRFSKQYSYLNKWPIAIIVGVGCGVAFRGNVQSAVLNQLTATITSINNINGMLILLMMVSTLSYFFFTYNKTSGPLSTLSKIGRYVMMASFGAQFANIALGRFSRLTGLLIAILKGIGLPV